MTHRVTHLSVESFFSASSAVKRTDGTLREQRSRKIDSVPRTKTELTVVLEGRFCGA